MVILITGATHTGKTCLAQKLLERYKYPYLSIDHLKMGLIRSGQTTLTPEDDDALTDYLWPIVREMIKTAIENEQNLIVEGYYIPFNWADDFELKYYLQIRCIRLIMSERYIRSHFDDIRKYACAAEKRLDDDYCTVELMLEENARQFRECEARALDYILIDRDYEADTQLREF